MNKNKRTNRSSARKSLTGAILQAGFSAGILDGIAATVQTAFLGSSNPIRVFNYVASGVFGDAALTGGNIMTFLGILFHLTIATIWAAIYFFIYPAVQKISLNWFISGFIYGTSVWVCMNLIVLPLSNTPPGTFTVSGVIVGMLIIVICVGIPIAYFAKKFFTEKK